MSVASIEIDRGHEASHLGARQSAWLLRRRQMVGLQIPGDIPFAPALLQGELGEAMQGDNKAVDRGGAQVPVASQVVDDVGAVKPAGMAGTHRDRPIE